LEDEDEERDGEGEVPLDINGKERGTAARGGGREGKGVRDDGLPCAVECGGWLLAGGDPFSRVKSHWRRGPPGPSCRSRRTQYAAVSVCRSTYV